MVRLDRLIGSSRSVGPIVGVALVTILGLSASEATTFKTGLILIFVTSAIGLHVLVNWAGELSLAQAGMVGLPAFVVAKLSSDLGVPTLALLPIGILTGVVVGAVVALTALRVSGLYVAVVTLAAGIAIDRYFFTKDWLVGDGSLVVPTLELGPWELSSVRSLFPIVLAVSVAAIGTTWRLLESRFGRALMLLRSDPTAAASVGVNVAAHRAGAYVLAGGLAGTAGAITPLWVQRVAPASFPTSLSFTYLAVAVVAGRGSMGGVVAAAVALEGFRLFISDTSFVAAYLGPVAVVVTLTRFPGGLNQQGRWIRQLAAGRLNRS